MINKIYTITSIIPISSSSRCWGWFSTLEEAEHIINQDRGNLFYENYYSHLVIEGICAGLWFEIPDEWWYQWTNDGWQKCEKPEGLEQIISFGMG